MLVLDPYDLNMIERGGGESVEEGIAFLSQRNPNNLRAPRGSVDVSQGLVGLERRFLPMAGGIRQEQLQWLRRELHAARQCGERAIVYTHVPILPEATVPGALLWNYDEVLATFRAAGPGTVALVLSGHFHPGGYGVDEETGTHHVTLPSPLHAPAEDPRAHCVVEIREDAVEILGRGLVPYRHLPLRPLMPSAPQNAPFPLTVGPSRL